MTPRATILGCGMRTPLGFDRASSAAAVRAGISVIGEHPWMIDRFGMPMKVTRDAELDPALEGAERLSALAIPAARAALEPIAERGAEVAVLLSLGEARPGQTDALGGAVAERLAHGIGDIVKTTRVRHWMGGHAGGVLAIEAAAGLIEEGKADFVLAGGVDSYLNADTLEWLDEVEQLHSEGNIYGFCPGEAAGFVLLGHPRHAGLLDVVGAGSGIEENLIKTEDICLGAGLALAFETAARPLEEGQTVDRILCDMNGERYRGNEYGFAVLKCNDMFDDAAIFETPADCWGDVGAATGPLCAGLAIEGHQRGYAKGPLTLAWASSEGGRRAAVILREREAA